MTESWFTSDLHLGHDKILLYEGKARPFKNVGEMNHALVANIRKVVGPKDTLWILGDVAFSTEALDLLASIECIKRLVLGNHDRFALELYLKYFSKVMGVGKKHFGDDKAWLTHIPVHTHEFDHRIVLNVHGHLHSSKINDPRYFNVCPEVNGLMPVNYDAIVDRIKSL